MKKYEVGIITIPDYSNYGNRLQNYALVKYFQKLGYEPYSIEMNDSSFYDYKNRQIKLFLKKFHVLPLIYLFNRMKLGKYYAKHDYIFEKFSLKYLKVKYYPSYSKRIIGKLNRNYKYLILGSDQIWNPYINKSFNMYFASFFPKERKIPLAVSFGVETLDRSYIDLIRPYINEFKHISVREQAAKSILENITNVGVSVLCDPTLLLPCEEWTSIAREPQIKTKQTFVFSFFLGPKSATYNEFIKEHFSDKNIVSIDDKKDNETYCTTDPANFLWYIMNAEIVLTDSFHACVFSIIFNKKFIVFSRLTKDGKNAGLDGRVINLLRLFDIENRMFTDKNSLGCLVQNYPTDVNIILEYERKKYLEYLKIYGVTQQS